MASSPPINIPRPTQDHGTGAADAPAWYTSLMKQMNIDGNADSDLQREEYDDLDKFKEIGEDGHSDIMDDYEFLHEAGVRQIFGPGTRIPAAARTIVRDLTEELEKAVQQNEQTAM